MKIIIAGGSGFIGRALSERLFDSGYKIIILSRNPQQAQSFFADKIKCLLWNDFDSSAWQKELETTDVIINLIGENIGQWPWSNQIKHKIFYSRIHAGQTIVQAIHKAKHKPSLLIQSSATGYYGNNSKDELLEDSAAGNGFLADVCKQWENSTADVESMGVKRSIIRIGPVLAMHGGFIKKMMLPFRLFIGGPIGSGHQMLSWIHIDDLIEAIRFIIESRKTKTIYNVCAPHPVSMHTFTSTLGKSMKRPSFFKVPEIIIKLIFGEMGRETILAGQKAIPGALLDSGFTFKFKTIDAALTAIFSK